MTSIARRNRSRYRQLSAWVPRDIPSRVLPTQRMRSVSYTHLDVYKRQVQTLKLFLMFTLPWFCIRFMGLSCGLSFWQVQLLTSLMLFLSNALPLSLIHI